MEKLYFYENAELTPIFDEKSCKEITLILNKQFSSFLDHEVFELISGYNNNQIQITLTLKKNDDTFVYPVEVLFIYDDEISAENRPAYHTIAIAIIDYLTLYFEEFLSQERSIYLPLNWSSHQHDGLNFYLRGFTRNLKLEQQADAILHKNGHGEHTIHPISSEF